MVASFRYGYSLFDTLAAARYGGSHAQATTALAIPIARLTTVDANGPAALVGSTVGIFLGGQI
jgi:hypothetical protein